MSEGPRSNKPLFIVVGMIWGVALLAILVLMGLKVILGVVDSVQGVMAEAAAFREEYENKPETWYAEFGQGCDLLLAAYRNSTNYPASVPVENNPRLPAVIRETDPRMITIWGKDHVTVTVTMISETEGFGLTWKRQDADPSRRDLMLGGCPDEGLVVYTR